MRGENRAYLEIKIRGRISNTVEIDRETFSIVLSRIRTFTFGAKANVVRTYIN